ncbi:MAG: ExbD/TolR family protein [Deltaproteobacteria bacterium]|nr:MAG: ExbD/TolR family protein [Deltaproteobacteria bacterium]
MKLGSSHNHTLSEINITPLVDVMLVLLIVFMVTAPLLSQGIDIHLPEAEAPAMEHAEQDLTMTIDKNGRIFLQNDQKAYTMDDLESKLTAIFERREKKDLLIRADQEANYGYVAKAIALAKKSGVIRVGLMTQQEPAEEEKPRKKQGKK